MGEDHGSSLKRDKQYEGVRRQGTFPPVQGRSSVREARVARMNQRDIVLASVLAGIPSESAEKRSW
jgi:hypothetical protein